ncbi:MAG: pyruvate dehydrogenase E1 component alpha subunit [Candidatus Midichloriaceae bacterium]|jgi:pyruvate dehydrogenase E1 component alpha subunit
MKDFTKDELSKIYERMVLLRRFEEKVGQLYGMGLIGGFCHLYIGQEAVAVAIKEVMQKGDDVITSYRDHGIMLALDSCPKSIMAELLGKETGCSKGKGGSMHMFDLENGFYGGHGIVGAQVSIGTGLGFAHKYRGNNNVSVVMFGDGAAHQGQVYESFNMAKLWGLPVLYIIENNGYAMGTSIDRCSSIKDLYKRGESFNIPGKQVDGMDFFKMHEEMEKAVDYIRKNSSPFLLEVKTYRYRGHSMSDPAKYRAKEEVEEYKKNHEPLAVVKDVLLKKHSVSEEYLKNIEKAVKIKVNESADFAKNSNEPDVSELYKNIYK